MIRMRGQLVNNCEYLLVYNYSTHGAHTYTHHMAVVMQVRHHVVVHHNALLNAYYTRALIGSSAHGCLGQPDHASHQAKEDSLPVGLTADSQGRIVLVVRPTGNGKPGRAGHRSQDVGTIALVRQAACEPHRVVTGSHVNREG